jgi:hypothetical protein
MRNSTVVCDRCGKEIAEGFERYRASFMASEEFDEICYHCASDLYDEGWEITDTVGFESYYKCCSCSEFFPENELLVVDGGELECRDCIDGDLSHGGSVTVHYGDVDREKIKEEPSWVKATPEQIAEAMCRELNSGFVGWDEDTGDLDIYAERSVAISNTKKFIERKFSK